MKFSRKTHMSNSCSCTSCLYKSESDRPSLQRLVDKKSKIDRLYYGKYIPLREKKLINKLVRTRAVYDDIRAQLVSDSATNLQKNADFKTSSNELQKSSAILEIVDLVDKGDALKTSNLSECCSCCSCSKDHLHHGTRKAPQHRHARGYRHEREGLRYNMKKRKGVRFSPKHIQSDPCTCTSDFLGFNQKQNANVDSNIESSLNIDEEIQPRPRKPSLILADSKTMLKNKITEGLQKIRDSKTLLQETVAVRAKESLEKVKNIKNQLKSIKKEPEEDFYILESRKVTILKNAGRPSYEKIKASQIRLKNKILEGGEIVDDRTRKTVNKLKQTKLKINKNVKRSLEKLARERHSQKNLAILSPEQYTKLALKIRKDSIVKFKEDLSRKKKRKEWLCDEPCVETTCDPKQCLEKLKLKRTLKGKAAGRGNEVMTDTSKIKRREQNLGTSSNSSNIRIQTKSKKKASKLQQHKEDIKSKLQIKPTLSIKKLKNKAEKLPKQASHLKQTNLTEKHASVKSSIQAANPRQVVRIGSSFSFNVEFFKENPRPTIMMSSIHKDNNPSSGLTLTNAKKQKSLLKKDGRSSQKSLKKLTHKHRQKVAKKTQAVQYENPISSLVDGRKNNHAELLPFECEPSICIPGICEPGNCLKLIQKRLGTKSKHSYTSSRKTRSTSSVTTKSKSSKAKQVQSAIIPRRKEVKNRETLKLHPRKTIRKPKQNNGSSICIGSTFSFNIEFYKKSKIFNQKSIDNRQELNTLSIKPKTKQIVQDKKSKPLKKSRKPKEKTIKWKKSTTGTETEIYSDFESRDKSTGTKLHFSQLLPYECEPGTCIPGECNPYECLERIKKRHNTRDISLGTERPENKSTYSDTKHSSKAAFIQSQPSTKARKTLVKSKTGASNSRQPQFGSVVSKNEGKQVVNIGSTFSFNIELSKSYIKKEPDSDRITLGKPINFSTRKKVKERGIGFKNKVGHMDTQINVKKAEKSSIVVPALKRCFCTLNLYKKQKKDFNKFKKSPHVNTVYTVNTAIVQQQHSSVNLKRIKKCESVFQEKHSLLHFVPSTKYTNRESLEITSSLNIKLMKKSLKSEEIQQISVAKSTSKVRKNESLTVTGLSNYLKRCLCIMNLQYDNKLRKLEPYECEPGICIPGECDPYECQKLIMKRLLRKYSKLSSTDSNSNAMASSQTPKKPTKSHVTSAALKTRQASQKERPRSKAPKVKGLKQAVKIGSTFSFDVEFYKNRPRLEVAKSKEKISVSSQKTKGTSNSKSGKYKNKNNYAHRHIKESDSQVDKYTKDSASLTQVERNRCFCTLKLHKKGKQNMSIGHIQTMPYQQTGIMTVNRGQNTKSSPIGNQELLPYECEPGTCIPGECNPYECLERINRRNLKETGVATLTTSSNMSSNTDKRNKKMKTRAIKVEQMKPKVQPVRHVQRRSTRRINKKAHNTKRQAVKIGSTFSFNIDFYKDSTNIRKVKEEEVEDVDIKKAKRKPTQTKHQEKKRRGRKMSTEFLKSHAKVLQTAQSPQNNMATMVKPFLQRCFCTLQLRNQRNVKPSKVKQKKYRSAMTMTNKNRDPNNCEPGVCIPNKCDPIDCEKLKKKRLHQGVNTESNSGLLPYECEPHFCIPGKCNPFVCLDRIKKRNIKQVGDKTNFQNPSKNRKSQRKTKVSHKSNKQASQIGSDVIHNVGTTNGEHKSRKLAATLSDSKLHTRSKQRSRKQLKRKQGGNRQTVNQSQSLANSKSVKSGLISNLQRCFCTLSLNKNVNNKSQNLKEEAIQTINQGAQKPVKQNIEPTKSTLSAVSTFIKKCFCTLKLSNRKVSKSPHVKLELKPHKQNHKFMKLEPYECEPNTCVPGECDPYECEKRIRKRLLRERAAEPMKFKHSSKSTLAKNLREDNFSRATLAPLLKTKNDYSTAVMDVKKKTSDINKAIKHKRGSHNEEQNKQSVRIGSSFSFNIEFSKDKSGGKGDTSDRRTKDVVRPPKKKHVVKDSKKQTQVKTNSKIGKAQGTTKVGKHDSSQLAYSQTKSNSTLTDPMLKRCFCTLKFHKDAANDLNQYNNTSNRQMQEMSSQTKMTHTAISYNMTSPYECPPFMCIPNECDPYDCERKLRKLNLHNKAMGPRKKKRAHQSVEVGNFPQHKSQKTQSPKTKEPPMDNAEQNIVEVPRFTNYLKKENWQGVKIGSNMSFNIEFYKEFIAPSPAYNVKTIPKEDKVHEKTSPSKNKNVASNLVTKKRLADKIVSKKAPVRNTESQVLKTMDSKSSNTTNLLKRCFCTLKLQKNKTTPHVPYPQTFEVRRAMVKNNGGKQTEETMSQYKCVNVQGVCRKIKFDSQDAPAKDNEMQTLLSYKPKKFNKNMSETLLIPNNVVIQANKKRITLFSKKRLTKKHSAHPINVPNNDCPCVISTTKVAQTQNKSRKSLKKSKRQIPSGDVRSSRSDRRTKESQNISKLRTSKSLMLSRKENKTKSKYHTHNIENQFEAGDGTSNLSKLKKNKHNEDAKTNRSITTTNRRNKKQFGEIKNGKMVAPNDTTCPYCGQCVKGGISDFLVMKFNSCLQKAKQWCSEKKTKLTFLPRKAEEKIEKELEPLFNVYLDADGLNIINKEEVTQNVTKLQTKTGKRELDTKKQTHDKFCECCICLGKGKYQKQKKKHTNQKTKEHYKSEQSKQDYKSTNQRKVKRKEEEDPTCVCGSKICAKDAKRMKQQPPKKLERKPCPCGSPICAEEIAMMDFIAEGGAADCECQEEYKRRKHMADVEYSKIHKLLSMQFQQEDSQRRKKRLKDEKLLKDTLHGNKNDAILVAESVVDVAKLGFLGISDVFRIAYRCARDPKHTWKNMKAMAMNPSLIGKAIKDTYSDSGFGTASRRIGMRISNMGSLEKTKQLLEEHAVTNYLLHIADKDPKKRMKTRKRKKKVKREMDQVDPNCNLYLSSLRKKRFMWIFNCWPSFYPHCMSLLNVWKQFAEVMTFLLAVVVWSPCIFAMEICRAIICCTVCTG